MVESVSKTPVKVDKFWHTEENVKTAQIIRDLYIGENLFVMLIVKEEKKC